MRIALVQPPVWWTVDPPLGLAQMAGCLKHAGHDVRVFDLNIHLARTAPPAYRSLWNWEQFHFWNRPETVAAFFRENSAAVEEHLTALLRSGAPLIGFSVCAGSQLASLELARLVKKEAPERKIVFGGQYLFGESGAREMIGDPAVDAAVRGAGDLVFPEMAAAFARTGELPALPGVLARRKDGVEDGGDPEPVRDLDALPFADFTGFPLELYDVDVRLPIQASRGCVWRCRFCSSHPFWGVYSSMGGDRIFAELMHHKRLFPGKKHFEFYDLTANGDVRALSRLADLVNGDIRENGDRNFFGWKINAVLRPEMEPDLLRRLSRARCHDIIYGVESGSPKVRRLMNKPFTDETAGRVLRDTRAAGITTVGNFMFGFPGETEEDFQLTLDFLRRNSGSFDRVYGSATFTSLEEHSYLAGHRSEFGIREEDPRTAHNLYWESADGTNDYLVRLERFERFQVLAKDLGLDPYKGVGGSLESDKFANLAQYYRYRQEHVKAVRNLLRYLETDPESRPMRTELEAYGEDIRRLRRLLEAGEGGAAGRAAGMRDPAELRGDGTAVWGRSLPLSLRDVEGLLDGISAALGQAAGAKME